MPQIRPIRDLRNTSEISEICYSKNEPVFITKNGYGNLVIMSIETYELLLESATIDSAIFEGEKEISNGEQLHDARIALTNLRRKHFG
jgi:PHD/YefM family antitoxin component YafN of YafNO toxin-antitoxin module